MKHARESVGGAFFAVLVLLLLQIGCNGNSTEEPQATNDTMPKRMVIDGWEYTDLTENGALIERTQTTSTDGVTEHQEQKMMTLAEEIATSTAMSEPCPCCPDTLINRVAVYSTLANKGCCKPCLDFEKVKVDQTPVGVELNKSLDEVMEIQFSGEWSGRAIVEGFCNIRQSGAGNDSIPLHFDIRMDGETPSSRLNDPGVLDLKIWPADGTEGVVRFRREFRVMRGTSTFRLVGAATGGTGTVVVAGRALHVTFLPDIG